MKCIEVKNPNGVTTEFWNETLETVKENVSPEAVLSLAYYRDHAMYGLQHIKTVLIGIAGEATQEDYWNAYDKVTA